MRTLSHIFAALICAFMVAVGAIAHAASSDPGFGAPGWVAIGYSPDKQTTAYRTALGPSDATAVATLTSTTTGQFLVAGRSNISVSARFDDAAQTCTVRILYQYSSSSARDASATSVALSAPLTITASSYTDAAGKFIGPPVVFDAAGATHAYVVLATGPTTHQVALWAGSF